MPMVRKIRIVLSIIFLCFVGVFLVREWTVYREAPKNYVWVEVNSFLKTHAASSDLLLFNPEWLAGFAQDYGRMKSFSVVTKEEIFSQSYPPASALWYISILEHSILDKQLEKANFIQKEFYQVYSVRLVRYELPSRGITYDFAEHVGESEVLVDYGDGKVEKAKWRNNVWVFENNLEYWNQVSVQIIPFRRQTRRCIWLHPLEDGIKGIRFSNVVLGKRIQLFGGISDSGLRTPPGAPVDIFISVNGQRVGNFEFRDTDEPTYHSIDTSRVSGMPSQVTFQVQTSNLSWRHFCFSAWSLKE